MRIFKKKNFGNVTAYEAGWAPIGRPIMTVHFYIVQGLCIDTGLRHMQKEVLSVVNSDQIEMVLLTHHHEDHSGNAASIHALTGIPVLGHPLTVEKMQTGFKILPYQHFVWGRTKPLAMRPVPATIKQKEIELKPIHTPGHSKDHLVYYEQNRGWLFSGDLYLADRIKYFRADERIKDQIDSLKTLLTLDFDTLFCSHNPQMKNGKSRIAGKLQFLEDMYGKIKLLWEKGFDENAVIKKLGFKEDLAVKLLCFGNVSMRQIVRSALLSLETP